MVLQRFSEHTPMPWANGGGTSYEIASDRDTQGEWTWRIALAPVLEDGDFSRMPCVDRKLLLVEGEGLQLTIDGKVSPCRPGVVVAFRGEAHTSATLARGPVVDLGLMFHRKKAKGNLWFEAQPGAVLDADVVVGIGGDAQIEVDGELVVIEHKDAAVQLAGKVVVLRRGVIAAIAVAVLPTSPTAAP
jgi:environmental stress-induced protein Ves